MGSLIFVHGTGVREESFKHSLSKVGEKLLGKRADLTLVPCFWCAEFGANVPGELRSVPRAQATRSAEGLGDDDYEIGVWGLLYEDPLYELRVLGVKPKSAGAAPPNQLSPL